MYKLLIVDDEERVRRGLKMFVNWEALGFEIVADVESAEEALDIIDMQEVHVLLTDIKMPGMDGLQLIERAKQNNASIKSIILSGYEEFESAKRALKLGALDFLTKPVYFEELNKIFINLREILYHEETELIKKEQYLLLEKERILNNISKGLDATGADFKKISEIGIDINEAEFRIIRFYITESSCVNRDMSDVKGTIYANINSLLDPQNKCHIYNNDLRELAVLFVSELINEELVLKLERFQQFMEEKFHIYLYIGIGEKYSGCENVSKSYSEAGKALEYRVIKRKNSILVYSQLSSFFTGQKFINEEVKKNILAYLTQEDEQAILNYLDTLLSKIITYESINILYDSCFEIFYVISNYMASIDGSAYNEENQYLNIRELMKNDTFEDMKISIGRYVKKAIATGKEIREGSAGHIIEKTKKYIGEHFAENVSLNKLSEILYVHPKYLSRLFKEKTSENFIDYLTRVRVEKSKQFLEDFSLKIYEVSTMVGYDSPKYFSRVFREITGVTPKEFRDNRVV